jgi:adenylate cyclase
MDRAEGTTSRNHGPPASSPAAWGLGLAFEDPDLEREFEAFYSASFADYARRMLLLVALLLLGDFLVDLMLSPGGGTPANWIRVTVLMPLIALIYWVSSLAWLRRNWQALMSGFVVATSAAVFWTLLAIEREGGFGFSSLVGILNYTFAVSFCCIVLGIQFKYAVVSAAVVTALFLALMALESSLGQAHASYFAYHVVTLFLLLAAIGWMREKYIRRDFVANRIAEEERGKADRILYKILPRSIGERIKNGESPIAEAHGEASVLFADLKGFTELASRLGPKHLVELLNQIFSGFDAICAEHGVEKIKTIGDAYMGVSGVPDYREDHALMAVTAGRRMIGFIAALAERHRLPIGIRIGVHTGPVIGGVIGTTKFHYDLWGDAVNIASRMESSGVAGRVQVSEATYWRTSDTLAYDCRGELEIKGKGVMTTYLLKVDPPTQDHVGLSA